MPCWQKRTVRLDMAKADINILARSLMEAGYTVETRSGLRVSRNHVCRIVPGDTITFRKGEVSGWFGEGALRVTSYYEALSNMAAAEINRGYTREVVKTVAADNGWTFSEQAEGEILVERGTW